MASIAAFVFLVVGVRSLGRLRHRHFVPIILEDLSDGFPSGAVGESSMHQNHVLDRHCCSPLFFLRPSPLLSPRRLSEIRPITTFPDRVSVGLAPARSIPRCKANPRALAGSSASSRALI